MRDLYTRALYKISSQDPHMRHLHTRSPDIPGPPRSLHRRSPQDRFTRPLWMISIQELSTRSLHKTSMRDLYTRALYKISSQDLYERPLYKRCLQDLFTQPPIWDISIQDLLISLDLLGLLAGALYEISSRDHHMRHLYTRSPDIPGPPKSLHRSSLQNLFTRPLWEISIQELSTRSLHKTSLRDLYTRALSLSARSLHRTPIWDISKQDLRIFLDLLDLFTGALYKISSQDLYERSLYKISWYPGTSEISSLQDLFKRPRSESNTQKVPRGLRGRNQNRHRATARAIRHARTPQRVARAETKNAPGWAPATFHQQNEHGATARAIRHAQSPERVAFANIKSAPRHSETQKIRVPTAPGRQNYNTKCDFSIFCDASTAPATKKWVRGIRSPVTATRNDVNIADPNSTTVSQNEHFELSKTDFKSTKYCACHE